MERIRKTEFLGREFLLWLWFRCETHEGRFDLGEDGYAELWLDRKIVLQSESDAGLEKVICSGDSPYLREARFALTKNKEIVEVMVRLTLGDNAWSFTLDSVFLNFKSFMTPKVLMDKNQDPDGLFYDKFLLIEKAVTTMDAIFGAFIRLRISPEWEARELPEMVQWIKEGI